MEKTLRMLLGAVITTLVYVGVIRYGIPALYANTQTENLLSVALDPVIAGLMAAVVLTCWKPQPGYWSLLVIAVLMAGLTLRFMDENLCDASQIAEITQASLSATTPTAVEFPGISADPTGEQRYYCVMPQQRQEYLSASAYYHFKGWLTLLSVLTLSRWHTRRRPAQQG
ncbi:hypothetical protein [Pseudomonas purpurea]|uniref:hypothetical protein n=1 Tax=Pseudomonas purpurea TaxID=3136737 RepID=UPI003266C5EB